ncbi:glycosyltransferase family 4 protein [Flavobacterium sp.]|uniref:glycosyltransferase family 4 protein n=1 Tax=Flavobacterium sp. TaxID=239 RepID=UPI002B4B5D07|nr:glycosyltransferase family 4 protein [Flavobacterium sp.]HLF51192.1 glycosyltransferase family 4 protein [Flavobacterium sp.]
MKIAILSRVIFLSGVTTHIIDLSSELIKKGHEVYVFTAGPQEPNNILYVEIFDRLKATGIKIVDIPYPLNRKNKLNYLFKFSKSIYLTKKYLKQFNVDVIHVHTPALSFIPKLLGLSFIKTIHVKNLSLSFLNQNATHLITISRETYKEALVKFKYTEDEVSLICNGVNSEFSELIEDAACLSLKNKLNIPTDKIILGIVGSIQYRKGHDVLLKSIAKLPDHCKNKIHLIILGSGNAEEERWLKEMIIASNLEDSISKFDFQLPKPFYDVMDILILPSRLEGFGLVVVEAMLANCCIIRSDVEGAYDQITDGSTGFLFGNEKHEALSNILEKLLFDDHLRKQVAIRGRQFAIEHFTSDKMTEKTIAVYQKVLDNV